MAKSVKLPRWTKLPPIDNPHIGCLVCGGGEIRRVGKKLVAGMRTRIYNGFGGWRITRDGKTVYEGPMDAEWEQYHTLMTFENMARKNPDHDWRAELHLPLRDATYQRQGKNDWVLVATGEGFA